MKWIRIKYISNISNNFLIKKIYFKKFTVFFFLFFFFIFQTVNALIFIDVDEFSFEGGAKGIRVVFYDTDQQKYLYAGYHKPNSSSKSRRNETELMCNHKGFSFLLSGKVVPPSNFNQNEHIICTIGPIEFTDEHARPMIVGEKQILSPVSSAGQGEKIFNTLKSITSNILSPVFYVDINGEKRDFKSIISDPNKNSQERRNLGELATNMTMVAFGYKKLSSQNNSDQNFDGVYVSNFGEGWLFLTESKCWANKKSAESFWKEDLHESEISRKVKQLEFPETKRVLETFIERAPDRICSFVHRIKPNGESQFYVRRMDVNLYKILSGIECLSSTSSEDLKREMLNLVMTRMGRASEHLLGQVLESTNDNSREIIKKDNSSFTDESESIKGSHKKDKGINANTSTLTFANQPSTKENLLKLLNIINNKDKDPRYTKVSYENIGKFSGYKSKKTIQKIFNDEGSADSIEKIWEALTIRFDEFCKEYNLPKEVILGLYFK